MSAPNEGDEYIVGDKAESGWEATSGTVRVPAGYFDVLGCEIPNEPVEVEMGGSATVATPCGPATLLCGFDGDLRCLMSP